MNLTGRQLFEMSPAVLGRDWELLPEAECAAWETYADKLNGMMAVAPPAAPPAESGLTMFDHWMGDKRRKQSAITLEQLDRARHHATCPYRWGKGECEC